MKYLSPSYTATIHAILMAPFLKDVDDVREFFLLSIGTEFICQNCFSWKDVGGIVVIVSGDTITDVKRHCTTATEHE